MADGRSLPAKLDTCCGSDVLAAHVPRRWVHSDGAAAAAGLPGRHISHGDGNGEAGRFGIGMVAADGEGPVGPAHHRLWRRGAIAPVDAGTELARLCGCRIADGRYLTALLYSLYVSRDLVV